MGVHTGEMDVEEEWKGEKNETQQSPIKFLTRCIPRSDEMASRRRALRLQFEQMVSSRNDFAIPMSVQDECDLTVN